MWYGASVLHESRKNTHEAGGAYEESILLIEAMTETDARSAEQVAAKAEVEFAAASGNTVSWKLLTRAPTNPASTGGSMISLLAGRVARVETATGRVVWSGLDAGGRRVAPGIYLYRVQVGPEQRSGKVVVLR